MSHIRAYLRASTSDQDATRAKQVLIDFAATHNKKIPVFYTENESGRKLERPVLTRLINEADEGDIILVEAMDRLTRLTMDDWNKLKLIIATKGLIVVVVSLSTTHMAMKSDSTDSNIVKLLNQLILDLMADSASTDYEMRRERSAQGIEKAQKAGKYKGRAINKKLHTTIGALLTTGSSYSEIQGITGASRTTISKIKKALKAGE